LIQQSHRLPAAALQSLEVSAYSFWVAHADIDASSAPLVALYYTNLNKRFLAVGYSFRLDHICGHCLLH
ncbi:MAG TPA: hypothetical protein VG204_17740, partial [Terriglobia bacterium]|nr:hypothetical protein [Terriglobia bacterium]